MITDLTLTSFPEEAAAVISTCLLSRLEHVPCTYRRPSVTQIPGWK